MRLTCCLVYAAVEKTALYRSYGWIDTIPTRGGEGVIYARNLLTGMLWVRENTEPKVVSKSRLSVQT